MRKKLENRGMCWEKDDASITIKEKQKITREKVGGWTWEGRSFVKVKVQDLPHQK